MRDYLEFEIGSAEGFERMEALVSALRDAQQGGQFAPDPDWLRYFDGDSLWRLQCPEDPAESFGVGSLLEPLRSGDYELSGCLRTAADRGRLEYRQVGFPPGGDGCLRALVRAFGHRLIP